MEFYSITSFTESVVEMTELEKAKAIVTAEIVEYSDHAVVIKTILKKITGNICVMSVDTGEGLSEKTTPFDTFVQVIDGKAEIVINGELHTLHTGQSILVPAHARNHVRANGRFKMITTIIKSGYE